MSISFYLFCFCFKAHSEQHESGETITISEEPSGTVEEQQQQQTLYVAIQPGANMDPTQVEQPAVYVEVVEAGSGTEIASSGEHIVQSEMVIDHG